MIRNRSIQMRIGLTMVLFITLILLGFSLVTYFGDKNELYNQLEDDVDIIMNRLSKMLVDPMWNMDKNLLTNFIKDEMINKIIYSIILRESKDAAIYIGYMREENWNIIPATGTLNKTTISRKKEIRKDINVIGYLDVQFTEKFISSKIRKALLESLIQIFILDILLIIVFVFSMRKIVITPIKKSTFILSKSAEQVTTASREISSASKSLAAGSSEQAASVEETSSSLEEIASMTKNNAENANNANELMDSVNRIVEKANVSMEEVIQSMAKISQAGEETQKIVKTIDEIAFQTNLLALNAAVEAARAGEAGVGFAVVADEVRNLALRAAEAARNTATLIEGTVKTVKEGSSSVHRTSENFSDVATSASQAGELVAKIAIASKEQTDGIDQVNQAIGKIDRVVQQAVSHAEESAAAAEELNAQAEQMRASVNFLLNLVAGSSKNGIEHKEIPIRESIQRESYEKVSRTANKKDSNLQTSLGPKSVIHMGNDWSDSKLM